MSKAITFYTTTGLRVLVNTDKVAAVTLTGAGKELWISLQGIEDPLRVLPRNAGEILTKIEEAINES